MRRGEAAGTTRCCLSTSSRGRGALLLSNNPKGWDATRSSRAKKTFQVCTSKGPWIMFAHSLSWGDPLKGNLVQSHWWPLCVCVCLFVCLNPFYSLLLPPCSGVGRGFLLQKFQCKQNFKGFVPKSTEFPLGIWSLSSEFLKQGASSLYRNMCSVTKYKCGCTLTWLQNISVM